MRGRPEAGRYRAVVAVDTQYEDFLRHVLEHGTPKGDRTGTGVRSVFGHQFRYDLSAGFPLITTKRVHIRSVVGELLWFLRGEHNVAGLHELGVTIWDEWADEDGDLGPVYGVQWRSWPAPDGARIDQLAGVLETLRRDPDSRRMLVSAWNVAEIPAMALAPCHVMFQFYVAGGRLSTHVYQRSADLFLGVPFNIASYALLTHLVAQQVGLGSGTWCGRAATATCTTTMSSRSAASWSGSPTPSRGSSSARRRRCSSTPPTTSRSSGTATTHRSPRPSRSERRPRGPAPDLGTGPRWGDRRGRRHPLAGAGGPAQVQGAHARVERPDGPPHLGLAAPAARPLPGRRNLVLTRDATWTAPGAERVGTLEEAAAEGDLWVIGGAEIYGLALPFADDAHVTEVDVDVPGDTFAPVLVAPWRVTARDPADGWHRSVSGPRYRHVTFRRGG